MTTVQHNGLAESESLILTGLEFKVQEYVHGLYEQKKKEVLEDLDKDCEESVQKLLRELKATIESDKHVMARENIAVLEVFFNKEKVEL